MEYSQERPGGTGGGDLRMMVGRNDGGWNTGTGGGPEDGTGQVRMMVGGIQERPGGTGGGPEDDGGWNTGETRWYRWRDDLRMMVGGIQERPGGTGGGT